MTQAQYESIVCWKLLCGFAKVIAMTATCAAVVIPTALILSIF